MSVVLSALVLMASSVLVFAVFDKRSLLGGESLAAQGAVAWMYLRGSLGAVVA